MSPPADPGTAPPGGAAAEPTGTLDVALAHAARLLEAQPRLAIEQAEEIIKAVGAHPRALVIKAAGLTGIGDGDAAIATLRQALRIKPEMPDAWRLLADHLHAIGAEKEADAAYARQIKYSTRDPRLMRAASAMCEDKIPEAEVLLREHLKAFPTDVAAIRMLAEIATRLGRNTDAENLLARCLELSPSFIGARHNYAIVLHRNYKSIEALAEVDRLQQVDPRNAGYRNLRAAIYGNIGEYDQAIDIYKSVLEDYPQQPNVWMSYGHALKTAGKERATIDAYEKSIAFEPGLGEAYWSLANLKTFRFSAAQIEAMRAQLGRTDLDESARLHFEFALGKALEDAQSYAESFQHYDAGNRLRRAQLGYQPERNAARVRRSKEILTAEFFAERQGWGNPAPDPIFVLGLPRSGSTLVEQILASHSQVEGTMELPDIMAIARSLGAGTGEKGAPRYPRSMLSVTADEAFALGAQYLDRTRVQRKLGRPFFVDKMPNNYAHAGLIHLILPNAKIIDARRHPLGCCFSNFKQHFARGQEFSYGLEDMGRYYRDYVELMAHFDSVLPPGRVHRVIYERMVDDTEAEVRALLSYCGLRFEPSCLEFYRNERAVRTASAQQVRQPINRQGVEQWQKYNDWLQPLRKSLGTVLERYPEVPLF